MARVILIDPPLLKHPLWDPIRTSQPLGIWSIGSYLQQRGHEVRIVCAPLQGIDRVTVLGSDATRSLDDVLVERLATLPGASSEALTEKNPRPAWTDCAKPMSRTDCGSCPRASGVLDARTPWWGAHSTTSFRRQFPCATVPTVN